MKFSAALLVFLPLAACSSLPMEDWYQARNLNGTIVIVSRNTGKEYTHNSARSRERFIPASTFKIPNTLIALQEHAVKGTDEIIRWDGTKSQIADWNKDQNIQSAFAASCVWFYQELARRVGDEAYRKWLHTMAYGNQKTGSRPDSFWLDGDLRISAREQIDVIRSIYERKYPFDDVHYDALKKIMYVKSIDNCAVYAKTGWGSSVKPQIGWYVGYIETGADVYFFASNIDVSSASDLPNRIEAVMESFRRLGIM